MDFTYIIILAAVLVFSPLVLKIASSQKKETKRQLRFILLSILSAQILLGFLNWENFNSGRSGFELSLTYPNSFLGLFFVISIIQIILILTRKSFNTIVVVFNFINSVLIFVTMVKLANILGFQLVSFASVGAVFFTLIGNIVGLAYINKDKQLLKKYPYFGS